MRATLSIEFESKLSSDKSSVLRGALFKTSGRQDGRWFLCLSIKAVHSAKQDFEQGALQWEKKTDKLDPQKDN